VQAATSDCRASRLQLSHSYRNIRLQPERVTNSVCGRSRICKYACKCAKCNTTTIANTAGKSKTWETIPMHIRFHCDCAPSMASHWLHEHIATISITKALLSYCQGPPTARRSPWRSARLAPWRRQPSSEIETWRVEVGRLSQNAWLEPKWLRISTYLVYLWGSNRGLKSCQGLCRIISSKFKPPSHPLAWFKGFFTGNHHDTPWNPLYSTGENHGFSIDWNTPETMAFSKYGAGSLGPEVFCHRWGKRITPTSPGVVVFHIDVSWKPKFQWGLKVDILLYFDMVYRFLEGTTSWPLRS
jgi:hypothetical protein